jgi:hypothetical protein
MQEPTVTAFFYGSCMSRDVLKDVIATTTESRPASNEYIDRILEPARDSSR